MLVTQIAKNLVYRVAQIVFQISGTALKFLLEKDDDEDSDSDSEVFRILSLVHYTMVVQVHLFYILSYCCLNVVNNTPSLIRFLEEKPHVQ